jgi:prevent-host-death family protein
MKIASVADIKARLSAYLNETETGPVVITRNGRAVAVLLAVQNDDELEDLLLAHSPRLRQILEAGWQQIRDGKGIPPEEFWRQVEEEQAPPAKKRSRGKPA